MEVSEKRDKIKRAARTNRSSFYSFHLLLQPQNHVANFHGKQTAVEKRQRTMKFSYQRKSSSSDRIYSCVRNGLTRITNECRENKMLRIFQLATTMKSYDRTLSPVFFFQLLISPKFRRKNDNKKTLRMHTVRENFYIRAEHCSLVGGSSSALFPRFLPRRSRG